MLVWTPPPVSIPLSGKQVGTVADLSRALSVHHTTAVSDACLCAVYGTLHHRG